MIDITLIRNNIKDVSKQLAKRVDVSTLDLEGILKLDDERKKILHAAESLKAERNQGSKVKPDKKTIERMKNIGEEIKTLEGKLLRVEEQLKEKMAALPNIPDSDVPSGGKENNRVEQVGGKKPEFTFEPKDHVELAESLGIIDYKRAVKMSGTGFWAYLGLGAELEWALMNYFVDFHRKNGYTFLIPPFLLTEQSAYTSGHLPKYRDDLFWTQDKLCLNATSEMMLGNYYRDEVLSSDELPKKYYAYSTCFRREAGSYRKEERGMIRGHQFNKIEMFQFTRPENSREAFDELVKNAESLVQGLGLHFQTVLLAAGDASAAMAKTVDIEVWIPSMGIYKEASSVSNATDYQARRGSIRFKNPQTGKNEYVHTLNGSGLATSRLVPAILEQFQQEDGSVNIPKILWPYMNGQKILTNKI